MMFIFRYCIVGVVANPEVPPDLKIANPDAYARYGNGVDTVVIDWFVWVKCPLFRAVKDWFPNRMFVGLTLSHAGSQSFADRVVGEEVREPTCVGVSDYGRNTKTSDRQLIIFVYL